MWTLTTLTFCVALVTGILAAEWSYTGDHGVDHWAENYDDCGKLRQSPINLETDEAMHAKSLVHWEFHGYRTANLGLKLKNNGHAAQVDITGEASVSGGGLHEEYKLAQFHFHWGSRSTQGSEHTIDGRAYPMEVHFVHYAASRGSLGDAAAVPYGLAVLGFFFEIGEHNSHFDEIINNLDHVTNKDDEFDLTSFALADLLPMGESHDYAYYRYQGSLTTPGCFESVIWTVFDQPIYISEAQLAKFRDLMGEGEHIVDNYRPVQPLNMRDVYTNQMTATPPSGSANLVASALLLFISAVLAKLMC